MQDFQNKRILLGICGGIAAYKTAYLARELNRLGADVRVIMTPSAQKFITPMTLQALTGNEVRTELFDSQAERAMGHIELARWADYLVIAPASANVLAKMAHGLADDLLSTLYLVAETPVIVCPAMNRSMWLHKATQDNVALLQTRGVIVVGPEEGSQACGEEGFGRLSEVENIIDAIRLHMVHQILMGKTVVITAGPTQEPIDPVRYITNRSSGKMGYALAKAAHAAGASVILITGPTTLPPPPGVEIYYVNTAEHMLKEVNARLELGMIFMGCAAVADYRVEESATQKLKKQDGTSKTLTLIENPDILTTVVKSRKAAFVVGFAAETNAVLEHAKEKFNKKNLDMLIANEVGEGRGFDADFNQVTILTKHSEINLEIMHKTRLAGQIIAILAANLQNDAIMIT
jgi:phosphopantothenoylcysteine decarboxylase/phosphopantothenate--cysteine ligase